MLSKLKQFVAATVPVVVQTTSVMLVWNLLAVPILGLPALTFISALGILTLFGALIAGKVEAPEYAEVYAEDLVRFCVTHALIVLFAWLVSLGL